MTARGVVDNVKVRIRTHDPQQVWEREFEHIDDAISFLEGIKPMVRTI